MAGFAAYLKIFIAIYVLVNPLEGLPVFLAVRKDSTARREWLSRERRRSV
jgi:small neutral amino acid transporter SnatA (MarC family)